MYIAGEMVPSNIRPTELDSHNKIQIMLGSNDNNIRFYVHSLMVKLSFCINKRTAILSNMLKEATRIT